MKRIPAFVTDEGDVCACHVIHLMNADSAKNDDGWLYPHGEVDPSELTVRERV